MENSADVLGGFVDVFLAVGLVLCNITIIKLRRRIEILEDKARVHPAQNGQGQVSSNELFTEAEHERP